jgi:site-specific recombinase XerD
MSMITLTGLARDVEGFLAFKRALGRPYQRAELMLRSFQRFAQAYADKAGKRAGSRGRISLEGVIKAWLSRPSVRKPVTAGLELGLLRHLCLYRRRCDRGGFVPEQAWAPQTESPFAPYVFSHAQIRQLLDAAGRHRGRNIWAGMLRMLLLVLYCTGLRFGEAVRLQMDDVDLEKRVLFIRESKGKSRLVPFGADLADELRMYLRDRESIVRASAEPTPDLWFVRKNGRPLTLQTASEAVRRLLRRQGLKPKMGRTGPRPYDVRHAFAVHRLTDWNRKGLDVHARLPWLSAYMGHSNVLGTEDYLHATPELLRLASRRFEKRFHQRRRKQ